MLYLSIVIFSFFLLELSEYEIMAVNPELATRTGVIESLTSQVAEIALMDDVKIRQQMIKGEFQDRWVRVDNVVG